jgi:uncharacterized damage-inducible protein DinB
MSEIARIIDQLAREHSGEPWHGSPLLQILDNVTAAQAAARPIAGGHSIWELVLHVTAWKNEARRRLSGARAAAPEEGDWPAVGDASDQRWRDARHRLQRAQDDLLAAISALPEHRLYELPEDLRGHGVAAGVSYYVLLHGVAQHDAYHAGQIAILKNGVS